MAVKPGDTILYIQKYMKADDENWQFRLIEAKVTAVRIGKTATKAYSKQFRPLDIEELESNTKMFTPGIILVQEPFLDVGDLRERAKKWIENRGWEHQSDWPFGGVTE